MTKHPSEPKKLERIIVVEQGKDGSLSWHRAVQEKRWRDPEREPKYLSHYLAKLTGGLRV